MASRYESDDNIGNLSVIRCCIVSYHYRHQACRDCWQRVGWKSTSECM